MLSKIDRKVREIVTSQAENPRISPDIARNPLVNYLKLFQRQHRLISILYKGLLFAFSGFVVLLSLLLLNVINSDLMPVWGIVCLVAIDLILIGGVFKAYFELRHYRRKSEKITQKVHEYLRGDIAKINENQELGSALEPSLRRSQKKGKPQSAKVSRKQKSDYVGWDKQVCPYCATSLEMMADECPNCRRSLGEKYIN